MHSFFALASVTLLSSFSNVAALQESCRDSSVVVDLGYTLQSATTGVSKTARRGPTTRHTDEM
jgi:hypothetical protein